MLHQRFPELDLLRSAAIIGMIVYHAAYDLESYYGWPVLRSLGVGGLFFERVIAITFLLLVGVSFAISHNRTEKHLIWRKFLKRGCIVTACGMLVSVVTYVVDPTTFVRFGILHLIGVSILLLPLFARFGWRNAAIGIVLGVIGMQLPPPHFASVDYFPLLPWFGIVLIGAAIGQHLYIHHLDWREKIPTLLTNHYPLLTHISRHSLPIYLIHQPILIAVLWMMFGKPSF